MGNLFRAFRNLFVVSVCIFAIIAVLCGMAFARQKFIGTVHVYGNEPRTYIGLKDESDGKVYTIANSGKEAELRLLQGKRIEFTVKIEEPRSYPPADGVVTIISYAVLD
ncbi:MAG: hypothetical protein Pg6C_13050 [Treponemataceae bacterium]|nr:MAG: hypothetical protein Pg6C_13050 [Treponemataceae bacterium]